MHTAALFQFLVFFVRQKMQSSLFALSCLVACGLFSFGIDARYIKRSTEEENNICSRSTPCGWEVYAQYRRETLLYVQSPCLCPNGSQCMRTNDDISISAYVHRCVPEGVEVTEWNYDSIEE